MNFKVRALQENDINFILSTWLRNYKFSSYFAKPIKNATFYAWHEQVIKRILSRPTTRANVCCSTDDDNLILGYSITEQQGDIPVIHYVYVKKAFRQFGIAKALLDGNPGKAEFTHMTFEYDWIKEKYPELEYNPYRI